MKIKKPVVGDVVVHLGSAAIVVRSYAHDPLCVDVFKFNQIPSDEWHMLGEMISILSEESYRPMVRYPAWTYPEQTDEMIEVGDER